MCHVPALAPCYLSPVPPGFADVRAAGDGGAGSGAAGRLRHHLRALPRLRRSPPRRPRNIHIIQVRISHFPKTAEEQTPCCFLKYQQKQTRLTGTG